jgi:hypothetical protein
LEDASLEVGNSPAAYILEAEEEEDKVISDDMSVLDCVDENLSEVESSDSNDEIGNHQESDPRSGTSNSEQNDGEVALYSRGWQMKIWLMGVPMA